MRDAEWMHHDERKDLGPESIEKAAILYNGVVHSVLRPGRHHDVFRKIVLETKVGSFNGSIQGFVTNHGRFVKRDEACVIAVRADQIKIKTGPAHLLFSEDIW